MHLIIKKDTTSFLTTVFIQNSSSTTGAGLTGLVFNSAGLTAYYRRPDGGDAGGLQISLVTATRGTWTSAGFKEIDATNLPGFYELGIPNICLATGVAWCTILLKGATNMAPLPILIQLSDNTAKDVFDRIGTAGAGLTNIPWNPAWDVEVESEVDDALGVAMTEIAQGIPTATPTMKQALMLLYMVLRNKLTTTASEYAVYNDAGTKIAKSTISDDGTTFTRNEMVSGA